MPTKTVSSLAEMVLEVRRSDGYEDVLEGLKSALSDQERHRILSSALANAAVSIELDLSSEDKSTASSTALRNEATSWYKSKHFRKALEVYTLAIFTAPLKDDARSLALAYANRSAVLCQIGQHLSSLRDITHAIEAGYDVNLLYKLLERQGKCYKALGDLNQARKAFTEASESLQNGGVSADEKSKCLARLEKLLNECGDESGNSVTLKPSKRLKPPPAIVRIEEAVAKEQRNKGRIAVASGNLRVGDTVLIERPYASVLAAGYQATHCVVCFQRCVTLTPCAKCACAGFCSETCARSAAQGVHVRECAFLSSVMRMGMPDLARLCYHIIVRAGLEILASLAPEDDLQEALVTAMRSHKGVSTEYKEVLKLVANSEQRSPKEFVEFGVMTALILTMVKKAFANVFSGQNSDKLTQAMGSRILTHLQQLSCNSYEITENWLDSAAADFRSSTMKEIGIAVYPKASLCNHSCDANAEVIFLGNTAHIVAMRPIKEGCEVSIEYGPAYYTQPRKVREALLKDKYYFACNCIACKNDWPTAEEMSDKIMSGGSAAVPQFKCDECHAKLDISEKKMKSSEECKNCGQKGINIKLILDTLGKAYERYAQVVSGHSKHSDRKTISRVCETYVEIMDKYLVMPWKDYITCQATLKQCYRMSGNLYINSL